MTSESWLSNHNHKSPWQGRLCSCALRHSLSLFLTSDSPQVSLARQAMQLCSETLLVTLPHLRFSTGIPGKEGYAAVLCDTPCHSSSPRTLHRCPWQVRLCSCGLRHSLSLHHRFSTGVPGKGGYADVLFDTPCHSSLSQILHRYSWRGRPCSTGL